MRRTRRFAARPRPNPVRMPVPAMVPAMVLALALTLGLTLALTLVLTAMTTRPALAQEEDLKKATFLPQWTPQAQFAGYYVAEMLGFFRDEGVDMTILTGGPDRPVSDALESGRADFGTMFLTSAVQAVSRSIDMVNVCQVGQRSALMLVARKDAGIETVDDLNGRKVGLWAGEFQIQPRALFDQRDIQVTIVPQGSSMTLFLRGAIQASSVMWYNEYHTLLASGMDEEEIQPFFFHELGLNFPEDGIYCLRSTYERDPELAHAVARAAMRGWLWAFENPERALDIVLDRMEEARVPASRVHQAWMLEHMKEIIAPEGATLGMLDRHTYNTVATTLFDVGFIQNAPMYQTFFQGEAYAP